MAERAEKEQRLQAMAEAVALYEAEFGTISDAELITQERIDRRGAVLVRGAKKTKAKPGRRRRA